MSQQLMKNYLLTNEKCSLNYFLSILPNLSKIYEKNMFEQSTKFFETFSKYYHGFILQRIQYTANLLLIDLLFIVDGTEVTQTVTHHMWVVKM